MNKKTYLYGLIGYPVKHSLSAFMHNAAFKALDINAEYRLFEVKPRELEDFLLNNDLSGFNITIPHKVRAREILEKKFPPDKNAARMHKDLYYVKLSGAINTVKKAGDKLEYYNTDASGFLRSLAEDKSAGFNVKGRNVLVIGCGGAGRAIIAALSWKDMDAQKIYVYDIDKEAVLSAKKHFSHLDIKKDWQDIIKQKIKFILQEQIGETIKECQLLINASPVGMKQDDPSVIDKKFLHQGLSVYDLVYNRETELIKQTKALGLPCINGLKMLLYQGADAFELWIEKKAPFELMREVLIKSVNKS